MNNFNPLVSIIIPVYNGANFLREAIDSALAQTYKNIEIIVVNDGSTDNTEEIVKSYGKKLRYFKKENGGVSTALNLGIKEMKGDYFSWLSHDDVYYPDKIEKQIEELYKLDKYKRDRTILYSNWVLIDKNSKIFDKFRIEKKYDIKKLNYPLYPVLNCIIHGCTLLIPKRCFNEIGNFNPKFRVVQDYDLWFKMFPKYDLKFMPNFFVKFRYHEQQGSNTINGIKEENENLWMKMLKNLTNYEKNKIGGDLISFYKKMIRFVDESGYIDTKKYLIKCLDMAGGEVNKIEELFIKTRERIRNKIRRILIRVF